MVTVVLEHVVGFSGPFRLVFSQEFHEKFLWNICEAERQLFGWLTERCSTHSVVTDAATIVILFIVDTDSSVPNSLEVFSNELHGHLFSNSLT
jgi:hypothetical protein